MATTIAFTEGPTVDRDGSVYFTDLTSERILRLDAEGRLSTFREDSNRANGLLIDPERRLIAAEGGSRRAGSPPPRVTRTDLLTGRLEVLADGYDGQALSAPNDVTMDGEGRVYFTDLSGAAVYRVEAPGTVERILDAPDVQRPNGVQVSPDDRTLYVIEANQAEGGARLIRAFDLRPDGTVTNARVHYDFYPGRSGDGMSIDVQGNLYVSAGLNAPRGTSETLDTRAGVHVISPAGELLRHIPIPEDVITNNAFGGPDMRTLYVTAGKTLFRVAVEVEGLPR